MFFVLLVSVIKKSKQQGIAQVSEGYVSVMCDDEDLSALRALPA
jgi:hypothetical protein